MWLEAHFDLTLGRARRRLASPRRFRPRVASAPAPHRPLPLPAPPQSSYEPLNPQEKLTHAQRKAKVAAKKAAMKAALEAADDDDDDDDDDEE